MATETGSTNASNKFYLTAFHNPTGTREVISVTVDRSEGKSAEQACPYFCLRSGRCPRFPRSSLRRNQITISFLSQTRYPSSFPDPSAKMAESGWKILSSRVNRGAVNSFSATSMGDVSSYRHLLSGSLSCPRYPGRTVSKSNVALRVPTP